MSDEIRFTLTSVLAQLRRNLGVSPRDHGDLERNAVFWLAARAGMQASKSSFALPTSSNAAPDRFSDAGYLAALGFAAKAVLIDDKSRAAVSVALLALMKRSPRTVERRGFADDPLCGAGLVLLASALGLDEARQSIVRSLDDGPALSAGVALVVATSGAGQLSGSVLDTESAGALASAILCDRIDQQLGRTLFPGLSAKFAEAQLISGVCRGTLNIGRDFSAMLTLAALELDAVHLDGENEVTLTPSRSTRTQQTILFLAANPSSSRKLALDEEARAIEARIKASPHGDAIHFRTRWAVRPDDLLQALNEDRPTIVHFSGHGSGVDGIVLHDESGGDRLVTASALKRLFSVMKDDIRVVVLSACYSAEQAREIATVVDAVVGMSDSIGDEAARAFAAAFYRALGFGRSLQNAFEQGLAAMDLEGHGDTDVPVLLVRTGVDATKLVLV